MSGEPVEENWDSEGDEEEEVAAAVVMVLV